MYLLNMRQMNTYVVPEAICSESVRGILSSFSVFHLHNIHIQSHVIWWWCNPFILYISIVL